MNRHQPHRARFGDAYTYRPNAILRLARKVARVNNIGLTSATMIALMVLESDEAHRPARNRAKLYACSFGRRMEHVRVRLISFGLAASITSAQLHAATMMWPSPSEPKEA